MKADEFRPLTDFFGLSELASLKSTWIVPINQETKLRTIAIADKKTIDEFLHITDIWLKYDLYKVRFSLNSNTMDLIVKKSGK